MHASSVPVVGSAHEYRMKTSLEHLPDSKQAQLRAIAELEKELANLPDNGRAARAKTLLTKIAMLREAREMGSA